MLKRSIVLCLFASMNLSAMEQSYWQSFTRQVSNVVDFLFDDDYGYGDLYPCDAYKKPLQACAIQNHSLQAIPQKSSSSATVFSQSNKDLQNVVFAISFLEKTKNTTVERKLTQSDIADGSMLKVHRKVEKPWHQKIYKKPLVKQPSHR